MLAEWAMELSCLESGQLPLHVGMSGMLSLVWPACLEST